MAIRTEAAHIRTRLARVQDAPAVARSLAWADPAFSTLLPALEQVFEDMLRAECLNAGCIEWMNAAGEWEMGAVGVSLFVSDETVEAYLKPRTRPFAMDVLSGIMAGTSRLHLDRSEIAAANRNGTLNLFVVGFGKSPDVTDPDLLRPMLAKAIEHYIKTHEGYHLARILREDAEPLAQTLLQSGMREVQRFPAGDGPARVAMLRDRSEAQPLFPDSMTARLFSYAPPQLGFSHAEKRVLLRALEGLSDTEIAADLGLSSNTVKHAWRSIYARAAKTAPSVLNMNEPDLSDLGVRGQEKRRYLIAYVRENPCELRPYGRHG